MFVIDTLVDPSRLSGVKLSGYFVFLLFEKVKEVFYLAKH